MADISNFSTSKIHHPLLPREFRPFGIIIMYFSAILFPMAVLSSAVLGSPLEERGTSATAVGSLAAAPEYKALEAFTHPSPAVRVSDAVGSTGAAPGVSKRSDNNELMKRTTPYGTLILCTGTGCSGSCYGYSLPPPSTYTCYSTVAFKSAHISASTGLSYGVFVGLNCNSMSFSPLMYCA